MLRPAGSGLTGLLKVTPIIYNDCSYNSIFYCRSYASIMSESGSNNIPSQSPGCYPHFPKRHSVATPHQTVPSQGPYITRTFSQGQTGIYTSPLRYAPHLPEREIDPYSVLKSVGDLSPPRGSVRRNILSELGVTLPSQIINR